MQIYLVGGAVRDRLLAELTGYTVPEGDRDWVVVGATPELMLELGYQPVGNDFPVFLHPKTHEEYALARTERKTAPGYHGFVFHASPDVTLEEDLRRRDLTINAMALDSNGGLIDPYGGEEDLKCRTLRHVSPAFAEDPVRILRVARFAARFPDFRVADETMRLMSGMVRNGEADALVAERILAEVVKGLQASAPPRMLDVLLGCGLWDRLYGALPITETVRGTLTNLCADDAPVETKLLALTLGAKDDETPLRFLRSIRAPSAVLDLAKSYRAAQPHLLRIVSAQDGADLMERVDAVRRPERALELLRLRSALLRADGYEVSDETLLRELLAAWRSVDAGSVARQQTNPARIAEAVRSARRAAVTTRWEELKK